MHYEIAFLQQVLVIIQQEFLERVFSIDASTLLQV